MDQPVLLGEYLSHRVTAILVGTLKPALFSLPSTSFFLLAHKREVFLHLKTTPGFTEKFSVYICKMNVEDQRLGVYQLEFISINDSIKVASERPCGMTSQSYS